MKVRRKWKERDSTPEYEVLDESQHYYVLNSYGGAYPGPDGKQVAVPKCAWEPVPTETWRDVTGECEVKVSYLDCTGGKAGAVEIWHGETDVTRYNFGKYRLSKVRYSDCSKRGTAEYEYKDAFIIEKMERSSP